MDKTLAGLIGAASALAASASAQAATVANPGIKDAMHAASYADLLKPIPNAAELLRASDAAQAEAAPKVMEVQYYYHHHHHHHHRYWRRPVYVRPVYHHHHHHHHHHGPAIVIPLPR